MKNKIRTTTVRDESAAELILLMGYRTITCAEEKDFAMRHRHCNLFRGHPEDRSQLECGVTSCQWARKYELGETQLRSAGFLDKMTPPSVIFPSHLRREGILSLRSLSGKPEA